MESNNSNQPTNSPTIPVHPQSIQNPVKTQRGYFPLILGVIVLLIVVAGGAYYLGTQRNQSTPTNIEQNNTTPTITTFPSPSISTVKPKIISFMRDGDIWIKELSTSRESKVSKTTKVQSPKFSSNGNSMTYHPIVHAVGGFPRGNLYLTDKTGTSEIILGEAAALWPETSRITWSDDDKYIGFLLFQNTGEAKIYDVAEKKVILEKNVNSLPGNVRTLDKSYNVDLDCHALETKYQTFCTKFQGVLNKDLTRSDTAYKMEDFRKSKYTKPNYNLTRSQKLNNGLVILEYYTGKPQNPESQWGIGGGSFVPGYDKGVTETYTILLDEQSDKVILEIPRAVDANFIF